MFEGVVGRNGLGNIAIDDISIAPGVCPTAPQVQTGPIKVRDEIMPERHSKKCKGILGALSCVFMV